MHRLLFAAILTLPLMFRAAALSAAPNFVVILAEGQGWSSLSGEMDPIVQAPSRRIRDLVGLAAEAGQDLSLQVCLTGALRVLQVPEIRRGEDVPPSQQNTPLGHLI